MKSKTLNKLILLLKRISSSERPNDVTISDFNEYRSTVVGPTILNQSQKPSPTNIAVGKILTDLHEGWQKLPKFLRWIMKWIILFWPFFLTFLAVGGDSIINNIIDHLLQSERSVDLDLNIKDK